VPQRFGSTAITVPSTGSPAVAVSVAVAAMENDNAEILSDGSELEEETDAEIAEREQIEKFVQDNFPLATGEQDPQAEASQNFARGQFRLDFLPVNPSTSISASRMDSNEEVPSASEGSLRTALTVTRDTCQLGIDDLRKMFNRMFSTALNTPYSDSEPLTEERVSTLLSAIGDRGGTAEQVKIDRVQEIVENY